MTSLHLISPHLLAFNGKSYRCASGKGGIRENKEEGDGATPKGCFPLREIYYRPDRHTRPKTILPLLPLSPEWGWCDDPIDPCYNQRVNLPYPARHEILWRDDHVYDLIIIVGYNDDPAIPGKGSAIFIHLARPNFTPTEGCIALVQPDLIEIIENLTPESWLIIP